MSEERMRILEMVADGTITTEQAAQLIQALDETAEDFEDLEIEMPDEASPEPEAMHAVGSGMDEVFEDYEPLEPMEAAGAEEAYEVPEMPSGFRKFRSFWYLPLAVGVGVTVLFGLLVYAGTQAGWHWFWMSCVWLPLLAGIGIMMASAMSRTARWVHVRVNTGQDEWPRRIIISLPLPLRTAAWGMKIFGRFIPGLDDIPIPIDEAITALQDSLTPEDPLYVHVEDSGGEKVEVYIG